MGQVVRNVFKSVPSSTGGYWSRRYQYGFRSVPRNLNQIMTYRSHGEQMETSRIWNYPGLTSKPGYPNLDSLWNVMNNYDTWCNSSNHAIGGALAYSRAYRKFYGTGADQAGWGLTLATWTKTTSMIENRATTLMQAATACAKKDRKGFHRVLGILPGYRLSKRAWRVKDASSLFLEYWFGWSPLISDMYTSADILTSPFPTTEWAGKGGCGFRLSSVSNSGASTSRQYLDGQLRCKIQGEVTISNPNLYLAERLGVLNPLYVLWDAIPWSFVLGWMGNFEQVINSLTANIGLSLKSLVVSWYGWGEASSFQNTKYTTGNWGSFGVKSFYFTARRNPSGLPSPSLVLYRRNLFEGKLMRALSAVALLGQRLRSI